MYVCRFGEAVQKLIYMLLEGSYILKETVSKMLHT